MICFGVIAIEEVVVGVDHIEVSEDMIGLVDRESRVPSIVERGEGLLWCGC